MVNPFVKDKSYYKRDLDILANYEHDMAHGLSRMTGESYERCLRHVRNVTGKGGRLEYRDPRLRFVGRDQNGDRQLKETTFLGYLNTIRRNNLILAPSMTVYYNPEQKRSISAIYIVEGIKKRKVAKKEMQEATSKGDTERREFKQNEQMTHKIRVNALSGAHCSDSTVLYHHTIHSSLTSTCRSASGYGNAHNERLIAGNRHYWSPDIVTSNILSVINNADLEVIDQAMERFGLAYPSVEQTMTCIHRSTDNYWRNAKRMARIEQLVSSLTPTERAAFVYIGDLYHIGKINPEFMRRFIEDLAQRVDEPQGEPIADPIGELDTLNDEQRILISLICSPQLSGSDLGSVHQFDDHTQQVVAQTARSLKTQLERYDLFIRAFLVIDAMPPTLGNLPLILRRCAVTSDTDSTIYTTQEWIEWYNGQISFDDFSRRVGHVVSYISSASVVHLLAKMCANIGVRESQLFQYTLKSEFYSPVFALTSRAKTYFASIAAEEGQIHAENEMTVKGQVFKGSTSPAFIMDAARSLFEWVLERVEAGEYIELMSVLQRVSTYEHLIAESIKLGRYDFFKHGEIKPRDSYKQDESSSPYFHYNLWEAVFAPDYGHCQEPPFRAVQVTLAINNKTDFNRWLEQIGETLAKRLIDFLKSQGKTDLSMIRLPVPVIEHTGVPKEIIDGIDVRSIISQIMEPHYVVLETLGYYTMDKHNQRLVSDRYPPDDLYQELISRLREGAPLEDEKE